MPDFSGKIIVVTGAGSGIGEALTKGLSQAGAKVTLAARRRDRLETVAAGCLNETLIVPADLTAAQGRQLIIDKTMDRWGRLDILINNAGLGAYGHFLESSEKEWRDLFEINLFAPVLLTQAVLPVMQAQGSGTIVNVASIGGLMAHSDQVTAYVSSKHALVGFSRGLARDLTGTGIRVLAVCPHLTDTEFFDISPGAEKMGPVVEKYRSFMDRPEDVARGIIDQLESDRLVVFPTDKPEKAYRKQRDI